MFCSRFLGVFVTFSLTFFVDIFLTFFVEAVYSVLPALRLTTSFEYDPIRRVLCGCKTLLDPCYVRVALEKVVALDCSTTRCCIYSMLHVGRAEVAG